MKNKILKAVLLSLSIIAFKALAIASNSSPLPGSQVGVAYLKPNDRTVYGQNVDTFMHPASTLKLITALGAVLYLGSDYTLKTKIEVPSSLYDNAGKLAVDPNGVLNGNVIVKFTGDPSFTDANYRTLVQTLVKLGVKRIAGSIILDLGIFGGKSRGSGWSWDDLPVCFTAPASSAIINRNCVFAELVPHGQGKIATPKIPSSSPIGITSDAVGISRSQYGGDCELEADLYMNNQYHLTGCVPIQEGGKPWPLSLSVSDGDQWAVDWTSIVFHGAKIDFDNIKIARQPLSGYTAVGYIESKPLSELIRYMLYRSNNLYADAIAKNVAYEFYRLPATYGRTASALRSILLKYAGIDLGNSYLVDGSGLSPHNLVSPHIMLSLLEFINQNDKQLQFIKLMPVAGKSGTMHWRASAVNKPLAGNVTAKTGTLQNISNLAGFITTKSGVRVPFVIYTNAISYNQKVRDQVKYRRIASPHLGYERYLLENIYNEKTMGQDF